MYSGRTAGSVPRGRRRRRGGSEAVLGAARERASARAWRAGAATHARPCGGPPSLTWGVGCRRRLAGVPTRPGGGVERQWEGQMRRGQYVSRSQVAVKHRPMAFDEGA